MADTNDAGIQRQTLAVDVFKTPRRPDTFLYLPQDLPVSDWPEGLADAFIRPEKVISLVLTPERPMAAQPALVVMSAIREKGYFLQLPPGKIPESLAGEPGPC